jgi:prenylated cyclic peptide (anacyclamide/piricyclamide family)
MKTKKLTPRNAAPVQRENTATVSRDNGAIAPLKNYDYGPDCVEQVKLIRNPFAGDDAE